MRSILLVGIATAALGACTIMDGESSLLDQKKKDAGAPPNVQAADDIDPKSPPPQPPPNGGSDASAPPPDAATVPTSPVVTQCGNVTCSGAKPYCCAGVGTGECKAIGESCATDQWLLQCDGDSDCTGGTVCCAMDDYQASRCVQPGECPMTEKTARMCRVDDNCPGDLVCTSWLEDQQHRRLAIASDVCEFPPPP